MKKPRLEQVALLLAGVFVWCIGLVLVLNAAPHALRPALRRAAWTAAMLPVLMFFVSCGGGGSSSGSPPPPPTGTSAGFYTFSVTGSSSANNPPQTVQLSVRVN